MKDNKSPGVDGIPPKLLMEMIEYVYNSDLDDDLTSRVLNFAEDTHVFRRIESDGDRKQLYKMILIH